MTSIANASELIAALTGGNGGNPENYHWWKDSSAVTWYSGGWGSGWLLGGNPGPGVAPGAVAAPTSATAGAMRVLNPSGGRQRWLRSGFASSWSSCRVIIYDRLLHIGGLSGTLTSAQTVGGSLTRYTGQESIGNIIIAEVYTSIGATQVNLTANYLDKDGNSLTTPAFPFGGATYARNASHAIVLPYNTADGGNSVTGVVDVTLSATTGTAGNWGITIARPLMEFDIGSVDTGGFGHGVRWMALEDVELKADACLGVLFQQAGATLNYVRGNYVSVER